MSTQPNAANTTTLRPARELRGDQPGYQPGVDVDSRLAALSTYLGHLNPAYTYYYLSAAPQLLAHAAGMLDDALEARP